MEVNHLRSAVDENTREVIAAYDEVEKRRREMESIKRALESMDEKLYVGSNTAATIRQEIEATQGELRRRIELEHQSRFFTSGVGAASALDLGRKPLHPLPEGPVPKLQQQLQQKQQQQQQHRQQQRAQSQSLSLSPNGPVQTYGLPMPVRKNPCREVAGEVNRSQRACCRKTDLEDAWACLAWMAMLNT